MSRPANSIRTKIRVVILTTSIVMITLTSVTFAAFEYVSFRKNLREHVKSVAEMTAANSASGLAFQDARDVNELLAALRQDPYIVEGALYDKQSRVFAWFPSNYATFRFPAAPPRQGIRFESGSLISATPVVHEGRTLGTLYMRSDLEPMRDRIRLYGLILAAVMAASMLLAWFLSGWLGRRIANPILGLANTARVLSRDRDYSIRANRTSEDEVGDLTDAFNDMLGQIQQHETTLRESEERFRTMANAAPVLIWTSGVDKGFDYLNRSWLDFTNRAFEQELGNGWAQSVHPEDIDHVMSAYNTAFDCRIPFETQFRLRRADSEYRWMVNHGVPRFAPDGTFQGYIGSCMDITERRLAEAELERRVSERTAELAEANRELESFTYSVSHDLRAPLRHVTGYAEILKDEYGAQLPPDAANMVKRIADGAQNMSLLVDDLLRLSRIGRQELALQPTDLNKVVREVIEEIGAEISARKIDWRLQTLPQVSADPGLMKIVFTNLISNALKYSRNRPETVIEIGHKKDGQAELFFIRDNGVGFDMQYAHKLFGVFQRLHKQEQFEGAGVGLAIVDRIIRKHRGRIWAESAPDQGATFSFTLPP